MSPNSLILGGLCLGSTLGREESLEFLNKAYKLGIRDIDTGSLYGNGMSEKFICEYQKKSKNNFKIHTKIGLAKDIRKDGTFGVKLEDLSYDYIIESTINALTRLEVEKIHRVSLHAFCKNVPVKEQLRSLNYLVSKGFIESYGICNFESNELKHWINECIEYSSFLPSSLDVHFNLLEQRAAFDLFPLLQKNGIEAIPYRVFCRGLLSDRYDNHKSIPQNSRASFSWRVKRYINEENLSTVSSLKRIAKKNNINLITLVLNWVYSFKCISSICIGTSNQKQLEEIVNAKQIFDNLDKFLFKNIELKNLPLDFKSKPEYFFET